jgi:hypothetical protein
VLDEVGRKYLVDGVEVMAVDDTLDELEGGFLVRHETSSVERAET